MELFDYTSSPLLCEDDPDDQHYTKILEATSKLLPKSDSRYPLVMGVIWWLSHRRQRMEQQLQRRRHFNRKMRRLIYLRSQLQRNTFLSMSCAIRATEEALCQNLEALPEKRVWVKSDNNSKEDFWHLFENNEIPGDIFINHFHMTLDTFNFIYGKLEKHLQKSNTSMREPLPAKKRLAATIYRLATNAEYLKVARIFGIGRSTITTLVRDVCEVIVTILKKEFLNLHLDKKSLTEAKSKFDIPQVFGSIGAVDVFILGCDWEEPNPYSSLYSDSHAVIFQAVVDHLGLFKHVSAGLPAGISNVNALEASELCSQVQENCSIFEEQVQNGIKVPPLVVGDESYSYSFPWILTPVHEHEISNDLQQHKQVLNEKIHKALSVFDDAVTKVKSRWKIFHGKNGKINFNADAFENIAMACCVLQNICEIKGDSIWSSADVQEDSLFLRRGRANNHNDDTTGNETFSMNDAGTENISVLSDLKMALLQSIEI